MKASDVSVGQTFYTVEGRRWRVTDVGTRTVVAIVLDERGDPVVSDPVWLQGPPYVVSELLFNEHNLGSAYLDPHFGPALERIGQNPDHPGFTMDAMKLFIDGQRAMDKAQAKYPRPHLLKHERVGEDDILWPYAAARNATDDGWDVQTYGIFSHALVTMPDETFVRLPLATAEVTSAMAHRHGGVSEPETFL